MAQSRIAEAYVQIVPTISGAKTAIAKEIDDPINSSVENAKSKFSGLGAVVAGAFAVGAVASFTSSLISAAEEEVKQNAAIENIAKSMNLFGSEADTVAQRLVDLAQKQALATGVDEGAIKAAQTKLLTFKNVAESADTVGGAFDRATTASMDLAAAGFGSTESNAVALGKALNDPIKGVSALGRMGVQFTEDQKGMIASLVETGDVAGAQEMILAEVERQVGGTAAATATSTGKMAQAWGNFQETLGLAILPAFQGVMDAMSGALTWMSENMSIVVPVIAGLATVLLVALAPAIWGLVTATWAWTAALLANPITWIVLAIGLLVAAVVALIMNWETVVAWVTETFAPVWEWLGGIFTWLYETIIKPVFDGIAMVFTWIWESVIKPVIDSIGAIFQWLWDYILSPFFLAVGIYFAIWGAIFDWLWKNVVEPTINAIGALFTWLWENAIKPAIEAVGKIFEWLYNDIIKPVFDGISAVVKWIYESIIKPIFDGIGIAIKAMGVVFEWLYKNVIKPVFDGVGEVFNWIWNSVIKPVVDFINAAIKTVGDVVNDIFGGVSKFIGDTFQGLIGLIKAPVIAIIDFINGVIGGLNKIKIEIPDWVPEWGGKTFGFNIPKLPKLAEGGDIVGAGSVMVGEEGPEILSLPKGARVTPLDKVGGGTINYYAAPNESIDSEEALFMAMRRAKVVAGW